MAQQKRQSSTRKKLKPAEVVQKAREQFEQLLGQPAESVSGFSANGNSGWVVNLEVVELERIPPSTSLLAGYEVKLDGDGDLVEYKRLRRYSRNQSDDTSEEE